jgi:hypothetical protein
MEAAGALMEAAAGALMEAAAGALMEAAGALMEAAGALMEAAGALMEAAGALMEAAGWWMACRDDASHIGPGLKSQPGSFFFTNFCTNSYIRIHIIRTFFIQIV